MPDPTGGTTTGPEPGADGPDRPDPLDEAEELRNRRSRRLAMAGGAGAVAALTLAGALAMAGPGTPAPDIAGPDHGTARTGEPRDPSGYTDGAERGAQVRGLAVAASGALYLVVETCGIDGCGAAGGRHTLHRGDDLGRRWRKIGPVPETYRLLAAGDSHLWIDSETVAGSPDGGHTWGRWRLDPGRDWSWDHDSDIAGGAAWFTLGPNVYVGSGGDRPARTAAQPPAFNNIYDVAAISDTRAMVMGAADNMSPARWYETVDRGARWRPVGDPCAGTAGARSLLSRVSVAADGSRWAACVGVPPRPTGDGSEDGPDSPNVPVGEPPTHPGGGPRDPGRPGPGAPGRPGVGVSDTAPREVTVSVDGGRTWQRRAELEAPTGGLGVDLFPVSATTAWRSGPGTEVYRTVDGGRSWRRVTALTAAGGYVGAFLPVDSLTAAYVDVRVPYLHVTRDGGDTWARHRLPDTA